MKNFTQKFLFLVCCVLCMSLGAYAQKQQVTGVVTDSMGPIVGATVMVDGTTIGVSTNLDGEYEISVTPDQTLVVSYIGYSTMEALVGTRTKIDFALTEDAEVLEDVVVVGYGTMRRSDVTGAIASVDPEELLVTPSGSVGDMLRGRAAGVNVTSTSGRPGSAPDILIRGTRSINADNTPLYIVDGVPVTSGEFGSINGNDISSLEILKDAAAQSIYGARASNGVVLVTTKRGNSDRTRVTFDSYVGLNSLWRNFDLYSPQEYYDLRANAVSHDTGTDVSALSYIDVLQDATMIEMYETGQTVDWEDLMLRDYAITQKYDIGISGGNEKLRMSMNAGYYDQQGIARYDSGYRRGNLRVNVDYDAKKWLKLGANASYTLTEQDREDGSLNEFITRSPYAKIYNEDGTYTTIIDSDGKTNPLNSADNYERQITGDRYRINPFIEIKPIESLSYKLNASYYSYFEEDGEYTASGYYGGGAYGSLENTKKKNYLIENIFNWNPTLKNHDHRFGLTGVISYDHDIDKVFSFDANEVPVDMEQGWNFLADGVVIDKNREYTESILVSYLLRANYTYRDKYMMTAAFRRDGSSKFGANNKWGNFPSVSTAWRIEQEPFMRQYENLDNLKLRVSWGSVGNQSGIGEYESLGTADSYDMEFGDQYVTGYLPSSTLANPDLKWETTTTTNIGLDFGFYNNRITGTIEGYFSSTTDLLVERSINSSLGYTSMLSNLGETGSKGIEVSLSGDIIRNKDWNWNTTVNFSKTVNEIKKIDGSTISDTENLWFVGESINVYYDYIFDGIYQYSDFDYDPNTGAYTLKNTIDTNGDGVADTAMTQDSDTIEPGSIKIKDTNGDGKITADDRQVINRDPNFVMSLSSTLTWKGFDLFADFYYVNGGTLLNSYLYNYNYGGYVSGQLNGVKRDYWTPTNPSNTTPFATINNSHSEDYLRASAYQNQSYFRLRTLSLGYTLPENITEKLHVDKLRFYMTATNLFTITEVLSYSPELSPGAYPETRSVVLGVNLSF